MTPRMTEKMAGLKARSFSSSGFSEKTASNSTFTTSTAFPASLAKWAPGGTNRRPEPCFSKNSWILYYQRSIPNRLARSHSARQQSLRIHLPSHPQSAWHGKIASRKFKRVFVAEKNTSKLASMAFKWAGVHICLLSWDRENRSEQQWPRGDTTLSAVRLAAKADNVFDIPSNNFSKSYSFSRTVLKCH